MSADFPSEPLPRRILLIEDSGLDRLWVRRGLALENAELAEAADGLTGLEYCRSHRPDLVLLDLGLPDYDGFEVLRMLKADTRTEAIPVIVLSARSGAADKERGLDLGACDFVTKPYEIVELRARARAALRAKRHNDVLERRAHVDGLTGLANRLALDDRLACEWDRHLRHGTALAVVVIDLDHFKRVNDAHGHAAGDEVLRGAGALLRNCVRGTDLACRLGGEEFVVVAPHCDLEGGFKTAERFRARLAQTAVPVAGDRVNVTASAGVAAVPEDRAATLTELLVLADRALYLAKSAGRNLVKISAEAVGPLAKGPGARLASRPA